MRTVKREIEASQVEKLQDMKINYEVFAGSLLDNYIFSDMDNVTFGQCKPRKYALIKEVFVNEWSSKYQLIMTDSEKEVEAFRANFSDCESDCTECGDASREEALQCVKGNQRKKRKMKSILKIEQKYVSEERCIYKINSSLQLANLVRSLIGKNANESFLVMCLNSKNEVIAYSEIFKGTATQSMANPREIFQFAMLNNATKIVLAHTHPSGDVTPSIADNRSTENLVKVGEMLSLEVLDHIIVCSDDAYYSYREEGKIKE